MLKIGMVGAGIIGKMHAEALQNNSECVLAAVADVVPERAQALCGGAPCFTDYKKMCRETELDAVIINLPHFLHCEASVYFLQHGINVLLEKPMAIDLSGCDEMTATAKNGGAKLAVGHVQRYFPAYKLIKQCCKSGEMGKLVMVTEIRNIDYFTARPKWFLNKKQSGGGMVMNYGAHLLDKIFYTTGSSVSKVSAVMGNALTGDDVEASAQVLMQLENGAGVCANYCGCHVPNYYETVFYFTHGAVKTGDGSRAWISRDGSAYEEFVFEEQKKTFIELQLEEFVKFLRGAPCDVSTAEYGRAVVETLERIYSA